MKSNFISFLTLIKSNFINFLTLIKSIVTAVKIVLFSIHQQNCHFACKPFS